MTIDVTGHVTKTDSSQLMNTSRFHEFAVFTACIISFQVVWASLNTFTNYFQVEASLDGVNYNTLEDMLLIPLAASGNDGFIVDCEGFNSIRLSYVRTDASAGSYDLTTKIDVKRRHIT